jgi:hypothetical protein
MRQTLLGNRAFWCVALMLVATSALAATKMKPADLELIANWFGGVYDSVPAAGAATGPTTGPSIGPSIGDSHVLTIERVSSPMISWHVFYAEERDADGIRIAQQLLSLEIAQDKKSIVERSFAFKEPRRWQDGLERPDIFKAIILDDLIVASGCEIFWFRDKDGFVGHTTPHQCRLRALATATTMQVDVSAKLTPGELVYGDRTFRKRASASP